MQTSQYLTPEIRRMLEKEIPYLTAEIRYEYRQLDQKYHLHAAKLPITFGFDTELLGSYTRPSEQEEEHFHFSLLFIGHAMPNPLGKEERLDLFRHEYAHYMVHQIEIPKEYRWQPGTHGSAWKYCCSLTSAAPSPYYKAGEALMKHDYDAVITKKERTATSVMLDRFTQEKNYRAKQNSQARFAEGDLIEHPTYGKGRVLSIRHADGGVRLVVSFACGKKLIDQAWLLRQNYTRAGDK